MLHRNVNWKTEPYADFNHQKAENLYDTQNLLPFLQRNLNRKKASSNLIIFNIFSYAATTFGDES